MQVRQVPQPVQRVQLVIVAVQLGQVRQVSQPVQRAQLVILAVQNGQFRQVSHVKRSRQALKR